MDRKSRVHVVGVRMGRDASYRVVLSDGSDFSWADWCSFVREDLRIGQY